MKRQNLLIVVSLSLLLGGCRFWDNSMTFFNTYYNQKKLMAETEEEFGYNDYIKPPKPRVIAPQESDITLEKGNGELPHYLSDMVIKPAKLQPVQVKVDSIIIKGSKILATHPKSAFVDASLYLMAKAFFYRSEWLPSNIKCLEIADNYPNSPYSPDAHLLSAKNYLLQRNIPKGKIMLSRTIDVAWQQDRYDVLSEAFQLTAEVAIEEEDYDAAERPYRQAITQCDDDQQKAKWQCDLGLVLYRLRKFEKAEKELSKVLNFEPTPLTEFEAKYYRSLCLAELKRYDEALEIVDKLDANRNFDDYSKLGYQNGARLQILRLKGSKDSLEMVERTTDSASSGSVPILVANFERGMELYRAKDYDGARRYFAKAKVVRSPVFDGANTLFNLLNTREQKMAEAQQAKAAMQLPENATKKDSIASAYAKFNFELARTHEMLNNADSAEQYFLVAMNEAPEKDTLRAQYLYSYARMVEGRNRDLADSVHEIIFAKYATTVFGRESRKRLGITDYAVLDSAEELYRSAASLRKVGDYAMAFRQYQRIRESYSSSKYAPAALYSTGWTYENSIKNQDSALYYYSLLLKLYPFSEYADDIRFAVAYGNAKRGLPADTTNLMWGSRRKPGENKDAASQPGSDNSGSSGTTPGSAPGTNPGNSGAPPMPTNRPQLTPKDLLPKSVMPSTQPFSSPNPMSSPNPDVVVPSDSSTTKPK